MTREKISTWVENIVVPQIIQHQDFRGSTVKEIEIKEMGSMEDNFASEMYEISLLLQHKEKKATISLLLKIMNEEESVREVNQSYKQFFNEIHMYSTIAPMISSHVQLPQIKNDFENLLPKNFYSFYNNNKIPATFQDAVVVLENLKIYGFKLGDRTALDINHCVLAFQRLGVFHACSYFMKQRNPDAFMNTLVKPIYETYYGESKRKSNNSVFGACQQRVIDALATEVPKDDPGLVKLRHLASRQPHELFVESVKHQEPLSVICHGDFLRNNMLFRYENEEPVDVKFIDFQMVRYASPAIDLSLLLCMNTSHELRVAHFDELLHVYHSSLTDTLSKLLGTPKEQLEPCYSFGSFLTDFRQHAINGYLITIEFLPWMLANKEDLADIVKLNAEERGSARYADAIRRLGGCEITRVLVDLAKDLLSNNCL